MALIPIFKICNIVTQKSVDKEKLNISMMCVCAHSCLQTTMDYCGIAHPGVNSKSGLPIEPYFTSGTLFLLFIQKPCQFIARKIEINIISLVKRRFHLFILFQKIIE